MDCNTTINFNCESFKAEIYGLSLTEVGQFIIAICDQVISGKPVLLDNEPALVNLVGADGVINWLKRMTPQKRKYIRKNGKLVDTEQQKLEFKEMALEHMTTGPHRMKPGKIIYVENKNGESTI
jgi:hypothetical protein